ncbi:hypothetical protein, partial [Thiohalomonas denitrificans]|uniref:hypothetical protein n=1 Tax=Thiohalomonas denitrificans TaxID=415747 RepID=UPI001C318C59
PSQPKPESEAGPSPIRSEERELPSGTDSRQTASSSTSSGESGHVRDEDHRDDRNDRNKAGS